MRKQVNYRAGFYLSLLLVIFIGPLVGAYILSSSRAFIPETVSYGHLILPPLNIAQLPLITDTGQRVSLKDFGGDWVILYVSPNSCKQLCEDNLYKMRQIQIRLGKNMPRVKRAIITLEGQKPPALEKYFVNGYHGTMHFLTKDQDLAKFLQPLPSKAIALSQGYLYLMDPLGNVMMSYSPNEPPIGIYKDLQRLLIASNIG